MQAICTNPPSRRLPAGLPAIIPAPKTPTNPQIRPPIPPQRLQKQKITKRTRKTRVLPPSCTILRKPEQPHPQPGPQPPAPSPQPQRAPARNPEFRQSQVSQNLSACCFN